MIQRSMNTLLRHQPNAVTVLAGGSGQRLVSQTISLSVVLTTNGWHTVSAGIDGSNGMTINPNTQAVFHKLVKPRSNSPLTGSLVDGFGVGAPILGCRRTLFEIL